MANDTKTENLNVRVCSKERSDFYKACSGNNHVPADILRRMMRDYTRGAISYDNNPVQMES